MTIKQHGGVFGRNPKFNSVEAESLSIAGNAVPDASTILVDGDIGSTVQGYDADTAKLDVAQTFTAAQTFNENIVMANTKGIDFSATGDGSGTASSELFDDYEEGEWTPAWSFSTSGSVTLSTATGYYIKVGRVVHLWFAVISSAISSPVGNAVITGLPYAALSGVLLAGGSFGRVVRWGTDMPDLKMEIGSEQISFEKSATNATSTVRLAGSDFSASTGYNQIYGQITYYSTV